MIVLDQVNAVKNKSRGSRKKQESSNVNNEKEINAPMCLVVNMQDIDSSSGSSSDHSCSSSSSSPSSTSQENLQRVNRDNYKEYYEQGNYEDEAFIRPEGVVDAARPAHSSIILSNDPYDLQKQLNGVQEQLRINLNLMKTKFNAIQRRLTKYAKSGRHTSNLWKRIQMTKLFHKQHIIRNGVDVLNAIITSQKVVNVSHGEK